MKKLGNISVILVSALLILIVYTFLHEGGHALFAVIFGGKITEFNINFLAGYPHASWNGNLENYERAVVSAAGPIVPYVLWVITVLMLGKSRNSLNKIIMLIASMGVLGSLIPNIIIPFLYESGANMQSEDIAKFIQYSGANSYFTALIAVLLVTAGVVLLLKNLKPRELLRKDLFEEMGKGPAITWIISTAAMVILIYSFINMIGLNTGSYSVKAPKEYSHLLDLNLSSIGDTRSSVYEFEITEPKMYDFYMIGDTKEKAELKVTGTVNMPNMRTNDMIIYSAQGKANSNFTNWYLARGKYTMELTKQGSVGSIKVYITEKKVEDPSQIERYSNENIYNGNLPEMEKGYELVFRGKLLDEEEKGVYEFSIEQDKNAQFSIFLTTRTGRVVLKLSGNGHEEELISEYQVFALGRGSNLKKGNYKLLMTSNGCDGEIYIFMKK